jgi:hypothetical protein
MCQHSPYTGVRNPVIDTNRRTLSIPTGGRSECDVPTLALHRSKESWKHYHPEDVWNAMCQHTRITWDKWRFCRELPPHGQGIHPRKGIPPGITTFTHIQAGKIKMHRKSFELKQFQAQQLQILYTDNANFFKNLNMKTSLKLKINLILPF